MLRGGGLKALKNTLRSRIGRRDVGRFARRRRHSPTRNEQVLTSVAMSAMKLPRAEIRPASGNSREAYATRGLLGVLSMNAMRENPCCNGHRRGASSVVVSHVDRYRLFGNNADVSLKGMGTCAKAIHGPLPP